MTADTVMEAAMIGVDATEQPQLAKLLGRLRDNLFDDPRFDRLEKQLG